MENFSNMVEKTIVIATGKQPELTGQWTIGEVLAAAEFLRRWIEGQQIAVQPAQPPDAAKETK
jgi:hypothetical protein